MKETLVSSIFAIVVLAACGDASNNDTGSPSDSASTENNAASTGTDTVSSSAASTANTNATADTSFTEAMNKMMQDMHSMKATEDPDHDFATMMKTHHQGAMKMSNIQLAHGTNPKLKQVAQKIIDDSQKDISKLDSFLNSHQPDSKSDFAKKAMDKMMKSSGMNMDHGGDKDHQFAMMMTMHHQQGIDMARVYLKSGKEEQTRQVANTTIKANSEDITKLKQWQNSNKSGAAAHSGH